MSKFPQTLREKLLEANYLQKRILMFSVVGTAFLTVFFIIACLVNPISSAINLSALLLLILLGIAWIYWIIVKSWTIYYTLRTKKE